MAKLFGTVMLIWLACIPVRVSAHDAYDDCGRCTSSCPSRSSSRSWARAAREPLRGLRAVSARVTLTRVLATARVRDGTTS